MVVHRDREDARERQLDHQDGAGNRTDAEERAREAARDEFVFSVDDRGMDIPTKFSIRDLR